MKRVYASLLLTATVACMLATTGCKRESEGTAKYNPNVPIAFNDTQGWQGTSNPRKPAALPTTP